MRAPALGWLRERYTNLPFALAEFFFGARVITRLGCELASSSEPGGPGFLIAAGFPTNQGPADYLADCPTHKVFIQSTHDPFGPHDELAGLYSKWSEPKRLVWIEASDHFFAGALDHFEGEVRKAAEAIWTSSPATSDG